MGGRKAHPSFNIERGNARIQARTRNVAAQERRRKTRIKQDKVASLYLLDSKRFIVAERVGFVRLRQGHGGISWRQRGHRAGARAEFRRERRRNGGEGGIRTHVPFRTRRFRGAPVTTTSVPLRLLLRSVGPLFPFPTSLRARARASRGFPPALACLSLAAAGRSVPLAGSDSRLATGD